MQRKGTRGAKRRLRRIAQRARQVEVASQPPDRHPDRQAASRHLDRVGTTHRSSGAHQVQETPAQEAGQGHQAPLKKGAHGQSSVLPMVLCRVAGAHQLQGGTLGIPGHQSGCGLHLEAVPQVRACRRCQPPKQGVRLCVPAVWLPPACGSDGCQKHHYKNALEAARLDQDGAFVGCPRCPGQRSQSGTPAKVCRGAVESRGDASLRLEAGGR